MKSLFRGYVRYTDAEFSELWKTAIFSFDTNVLLNTYRMNKNAADAFLDIIKRLKERVWLTHQVAAEFFLHYTDEVQKQFVVYESVEKHLKALASEFIKEFPRHPYIPVEAFAKRLDALAVELGSDLERAKTSHKDPTYDDPALAVFLELFDGKVRHKPTESEIKKWRDEAESRYAKRIPPGFADAKLKQDERKYGDAILWFQLLEYANKEKRPIIFVTDETKEDWWQRVKGKTLGPLPALIQEMHETSGVMFYAYPMHRFVDEATKLLGGKANTDVLKEIKKTEQETVKTPKRKSVWSNEMYNQFKKALSRPNFRLDEEDLRARLSKDAIMLLCAVAEHRDGQFFLIHTFEGMSVFIGNRNFVTEHSEEGRKRWVGAIAELINESLIQPGRNEASYVLTNLGINVASQITNWLTELVHQAWLKSPAGGSK